MSEVFQVLVVAGIAVIIVLLLLIYDRMKVKDSVIVPSRGGRGRS